MLLIAEFATNNNVSDITTVSLFFAIRGYNTNLPEGSITNTDLVLKEMLKEQRLDTAVADMLREYINKIYNYVQLQIELI